MQHRAVHHLAGMNNNAWVRILKVQGRTPPWETICFTQTGQRSGELTANSDHIDAQESLAAEVCVTSGFRPMSLS